MKVNKHHIGLILGSFLGFWHVVWSLFLGLGLAQPLLDFVFKLHRIVPMYQILPFDFVTAVELVTVTFVIGYMGGWVLGTIWNKVHKY